MEENKNSAKEKVESIAKKNSNSPNKEKINAQKRLDSAKAKREKKDNAKKAKLEEKKRKKELKEQIKQEREKKLKQEKSLKMRAKKAKFAKKQEEKRVKLAKKIEARREKLALKEAKREQARIRKEEKRKNKSQRRGHAIGGWLATVISLGTACLVLATLLTVNLMGGNQKMATTQMDAMYTKSFTELVDYVDNIDVNLSKVLVASDKGKQQKLLVKISEESALAESSLEDLPIRYEDKYYTVKFINQVGDYSKYLNNRLIDGYSISKDEYNTLQDLYEINVELKNNLIEINQEVMSGKSIKDLFKKSDSVGRSTFVEMQSRAVDYPKLIYDGPFSDGLNNREVKGLKGVEITKSQAEEQFKKYFADYKFSTIEVVGETSGQYECYNVTAQDEFGVEVFAQISKKGGKIIEFSYPKKCEVGELAEEQCINYGLEFLSSLGIKNMTPVWSETNDRMLTVNYAYKQDGVIVYSDLIKLNICREKGQVFGLEAKGYYLNHTLRDIESAKISRETAIEKAGDNISIDVESARLALIPYGNSSEVLTYELSGEHNGATYFVYIDASTAREVEIFKVIETNDGNLLI